MVAELPNQTVRLTKIGVPGARLRAFDISWVDSASGQYYLADRSNAPIDVVDVATNQVSKQTGGFVGEHSQKRYVRARWSPDDVFES
jgi:hypothetical protein